MIAFLEAARAGLFNRNNIFPNILAGIVVGIVTIPLSMAFAIAANAKPEVGLYTSIIAAFCVSVFGGTRIQISGPTGAFVGLLLSISAQFGPDGLQLATILAGIILIIMGMVHCGKIIRFIPEQVVIGFTIGISINLLIGQFPNFCGLTCRHLSVNFAEKITQIYQALPTIDCPTTVLAVISLLTLIFNKYTFFRSIPAPIMALFCGIFIQSIFQFGSVSTVGSAFGGIPQALPSFQIPPNITAARLYSLLPSAFALAMLGAIESLLSAIIADRITGQKHSSDQELIGQGIANAVCPFFGGIASTGSIARTASSVRAGGNSPLAGIVSSITLICIICFCAPLANNVPLATLAAIIFMVAFRMIHPASLFSLISHSPKLDVLILFLTCTLTIVYGIVLAVNIGVILSALIIVYRLISSTTIHDESADFARDFHTSPNIAIYRITGPFFFGILDKFDHMIDQMQPEIDTLILDLSDVAFIDTAGLQALRDLTEQFKHTGKKVIFAEAQPQIIQKLNQAQIMDFTGNNSEYLTIPEVLNIANTPRMDTM